MGKHVGSSPLLDVLTDCFPPFHQANARCSIEKDLPIHSSDPEMLAEGRHLSDM